MDVELSQFQKDLLESVREMNACRGAGISNVASSTTCHKDVQRKRKKDASIEEKHE
ncbi:hypothetical protein [Pseudomonas sp. A-RE-19]|uniref:hypothetical protein n=1 Tax=Pseudomonas sp. A-RE-19 TaxID=2832401 RepID=UPI001CBBBCF4|nr:hypothetical protein [Pseudomonas sp. A-RE-19]